jgi:hypothetical protein
VNAPRIVGKHFGPHPYSTLKPILEKKNIFRRLLETGKTPYFANAFPQRFFDYVEQRRSRLTVTTLSCIMSGVPLLRVEDLRRGEGISADITNAAWPAMGYPDVEAVTPAEAGRRLVRLSHRHDFVLFEYWQTDHAGHARNMHEAIDVLEKFDGMVGGILEAIDTAQTLLLITSDHGNIEDLSTKTHTRNPVPTILYGKFHQQVTRKLQGASAHGGNLTHITPVLMEYLTHK